MTTLLIQFARTADKAISAAVAAARAGGSLAAAKGAAASAATGYDPDWKGKKLLTPGLRASLTSALGHLAFNIAAAESGRPLE